MSYEKGKPMTEAAALPKDLDQLTPMMRQYMEIKAGHQDALLFYRMGDFYELFFEDAVVAAKALDIALTKRGKVLEDEVPMCGVPVHAYETYLARLVKKGFRVAICEQVESPQEAKKRGYKAVVKREVIRLVTPGTLMEENLLAGTAHNFLIGLNPVGRGAKATNYALAAIDISTGTFQLQTVKDHELGAVLQGLAPREILFPDALLESPKFRDLMSGFEAAWQPQPKSKFNALSGTQALCKLFEVKTLEGFGTLSPEEIAIAGVVTEYIRMTQKGEMPRLNQPQLQGESGIMALDRATLQNLEIFSDLWGNPKAGLLAALDQTCTPQGGRLLRQHFLRPLDDLEKIQLRQDLVTFFVQTPGNLARLRDFLTGLADGERALSRIVMGRGTPRDLGYMRDVIQVCQDVKQLIAEEKQLPSLGRNLAAQLETTGSVLENLKAALVDELPPFTKDGGFICTGYDEDLDQLQKLRHQAGGLLAELQEQYRQETGIGSLKIKHNNILGYFIEVPQGQKDKMTDAFQHRQTMANAMRFTTPDLATLEEKILSADAQALAKELELFQDFCIQIGSQERKLTQAFRALGLMDVCANHAWNAVQSNFCCPELMTDQTFEIEGGRHPVVERSLVSKGESFTVNDCCMATHENLWLMTGPNMGGKSTFLRQNALIVLLAQMGSYVPAKSARLGLVDALFSRVGASDNLSQGQSTFMVEMVETAAILNRATSRSFVILDEVGRGTATYDGVSLAWAVVEHLHNAVGCRCLFATHYHELVSLKDQLTHVVCYTLKVQEWEGEIILLHQVIPGASDKSYGIHVAKLAGLPKAVVSRAQTLLKQFSKELGGGAQLTLMPQVAPAASEPPPSAVEEKLRTLDLDDLTPRQAWDMLAELQNKLS